MKQIIVLIFILKITLVSGQSWTLINSPTVNKIIDCSFVTQKTGWVITWDSIYKTTDGGISWNVQRYPSYPPKDAWNLRTVNFIDTSYGVISCGNYDWPSSLLSTILWTTNGGTTWNFKDINNIDDDYTSDVVFVDTTTVYAIGEYGSGKKTIDGGINWTSLDHFFGNGKKIFPINRDTAFFVGNNHLYPSSGIIGKTINGGISWDIYLNSDTIKFGSIYFNDYLNGWVGGCYGVIKYTDNSGQRWTQANTKGITSCINDLQFVNQTNGWAVTDDGKILRSIDGGRNWDIAYNGTTPLNGICFPKLNNMGFAVGDNGQILKYVLDTKIVALNETSGISVFPNPFEDKITINFDDPVTHNTILTIYNSIGAVILTKRISNKMEEIDLTLFNSGVYVVSIINGPQMIEKKIIKYKK